ncbi:hypothetical protein [Streptomyces phaeochromogenes]|uniref:hypothetical protein n=1 Tax=Streptomyces phaeochromogenes TaxID=1923 RepID=UPI002E2D79E1|nr:hypothetical protein [Streptomyces phaeochromogenes]
MSLYTRMAATLSVAASFIGLVGLAPQASASAASDGTHCSVVVERVKPGEKFSRVKSRTCSDTGTAAVNRSGRTLLMTWYEHAEYGGASTDVYGDYGPCDADGYVLSTGTWWRSISSFITYNSCDGQQAVLNDGQNAVYYYGFGTPNVGARANDNIGWFKVWDAL